MAVISRNLKIFDLRKIGLIAVFSIVLVLLLTGSYSKTSINGECYNRDTVCVGLPTENCLGLQFEEINIESEQKCDKSEEIISTCEDFGRNLCEAGQMNWKDSAEVSGLKCSQWNQKYDVGEVC